MKRRQRCRRPPRRRLPSAGRSGDSATLAGGFTPGGTITFNVFGPGDSSCATSLSSSTATANGNGTYTSGTFTPSSPGTYLWVASYGGDSDNNGATASCGATGESVVVAKATTSISTQASAGVPVGGSVSDTATLGGGSSPTGSVTFTAYGPADATCAGTAVFTATDALSGGAATSDPFTPSTAGIYHWVASYGGDSSNAPVAGSCGDSNESVAVGKASPTW